MKPTLRRIIINTFSNYGLKAIQLVLSLVTIPVFINQLGEDGFGLIVFAGIFVGYFLMFDLGLTTSITKLVAQYIASGEDEEINRAINTGLATFLAIGAVIFFGICLFIFVGGFHLVEYVDDSEYTTYISTFFIAGLLSLFEWPRMVVDAALKGAQNYVAANVARATGRVVASVAALILALNTDLPVQYIFLAYNIDKVIVPFWQYASLKKTLPQFCMHATYAEFGFLRKCYKFSLWVMLGQIAVLLEYQVDSLLIVGFLSVSDIAVYTVIFYLFGLIQQISGLAVSAVLPAASFVHELKGLGGIKEMLFAGTRFHSLLYIPIAVVCFALCEPFVRIWMEGKYLEHIWIIQLTIIFQVFWQSTALLGSIYISTGRSIRSGLIAIAVGILNLIFSLILVQAIGLYGVIIGTIFAGFIGVPMAVYFLLPELEISRREFVATLAKVQLPFLILIAGIYLIQFDASIIVQWYQLAIAVIVILIVLYTFIYFILLDRKDKEIINRAVRARG